MHVQPIQSGKWSVPCPVSVGTYKVQGIGLHVKALPSYEPSFTHNKPCMGNKWRLDLLTSLHKSHTSAGPEEDWHINPLKSTSIFTLPLHFRGLFWTQLQQRDNMCVYHPEVIVPDTQTSQHGCQVIADSAVLSFTTRIRLYMQNSERVRADSAELLGYWPGWDN